MNEKGIAKKPWARKLSLKSHQNSEEKEVHFTRTGENLSLSVTISSEENFSSGAYRTLNGFIKFQLSASWELTMKNTCSYISFFFLSIFFFLYALSFPLATTFPHSFVNPFHDVTRRKGIFRFNTRDLAQVKLLSEEVFELL